MSMRKSEWFKAISFAESLVKTLAVAITFFVIASFITSGWFGFLSLFSYLALIPGLIILSLNKRYCIQVGTYIEIDHTAYGWVSLIWTALSPLGFAGFAAYHFNLFTASSPTFIAAGVFYVFIFITSILASIFGIMCSLKIMKVSDLIELKIRSLENKNTDENSN